MNKLSFNSPVSIGSKSLKIQTILFGILISLTGLTQAGTKINFTKELPPGYNLSSYEYPTICSVVFKDLNPTNASSTAPLDGYRYQVTTNCPTSSSFIRYTLSYVSSVGSSQKVDDLEVDLPANSVGQVTKLLSIPSTASNGTNTQAVLKIIPRFDPLGDEYWVSAWLKPNASGNRIMNFSDLQVYQGTQNIGLNQPVNASSNQNYVGGLAPGLWPGVDGVTTGGYEYLSGYSEPSPRYTVRVPGKIPKLTKLVFYNRTTDGLSDRSNNMYFIASPYDPRDKTLTATLADPPVKSYLMTTAPTSNASPKNVAFADLKAATAAPGYYLSLWLPPSTGVTSKMLNFNEVMVYNQSGTTNVALKQATTSSLAPPTGRTSASVVDGTTTFTSTTFSSTAEASPRWTVKLPGNITDFSHLDFYNRTDCCSDRSDNLYFLLSTSNPVGKSFSTVRGDTSTLFYYMNKAPTTATAVRIKKSQFSNARP